MREFWTYCDSDSWELLKWVIYVGNGKKNIVVT